MNNRFEIVARPLPRHRVHSSTRTTTAGAPAVRRAAWGAAPTPVKYNGRRPALLEGLETRTFLSVSLNSQGFTVVTPSADTRIVYVSTSGNDANSGLSTASPVATIAKARTLVRSGFPDEILLRRGDTWFGSGLAQWNLSGRSADEPFVLGAYTDPAAPSAQRPKLATGITTGFLASGATQNSNVYIMGIAFEAHTRNYREPPSGNAFTTGYREEAANGTNGLRVVGPFDNLLVEDCSFQYYKTNITMQSTTASDGTIRQVANVRLRRNVIADAYAPDIDGFGLDNGTTAIGVYADDVRNLTIDGNVFSHNGWAADNALGAIATVHNHNAYINTKVTGFVFTNNVVADGASHGIQARAGGIVKNNLFLRNPIGMSFGYMNGEGVRTPGGVYGEVSGNVFVGTGRIVDANRAYGLEIGHLRPVSQGGGTLVKNNVFANDNAGVDQYAIKLDVGSVTNASSTPDVGISDLTIDGNEVYSWARGMYVHPGYNAPANASYRPLSGLVVKNNDFQRLFYSTGTLVDRQNGQVPGAESWSNNRFDGTTAETGSLKWFRVGSTQYTFDQYRAAFEPTAVRAQGLFPDPGRDAAKYNASIGGTGTTDAFVAEALKQSRLYWRPKYTAAPTLDYIRAGYAGGRVDAAAPTASADADNVLVAGGASQTFTVTWDDDNKLDATTLGDGDVRVVGPNGYSAAATLVSSTGNAAGDRRVATYRVAAPGGAWSAAANGVYSVVVEPGQVADVSGKAAAVAAVGQFAVAIAGGTPSAVASAPAIVTDTAPATVTVTYTGAATPSVATIVTPLNAGFETPNAGAGYLYNPTDGNWAFNGTSGVAANFSPLTSGNPAAPQGGQVAFVQSNGSVVQGVDGWQAGTYAVSFQAAQRAGQPSAQSLQVWVDDQYLGTYSPGGTGYEQFTTPQFTVAAGSHAVWFIGTGPAGADTTAFVDDVRIAGRTTGSQQLVAGATLGAGDVRLTGPNGFSAVATAAAVADATDGPQRTVVYTVPAPAAGWSDAGASTLAIQVVAGQVLATDGSAVPAGRIGQVAVATDGPSAVVNAPDVPPTLVGNHTFQVTYTSPNPGLAATIDNNDLRVLGPAGYSQPATLASFFGDGTVASPLVATYTIPTPASGWATGANGTYNVVAQANQVVDANGNALAAGAIGQFAVSVDRSAPLATSTVQDITTPMSAARTVYINYYDVSGINQATLDSADVRVTGPNGYDSAVTRTGTITTRGLGLKVPYALAAPAGGWKSRMNGTYTVTLQAGQVADSLGFTSTAAKAIGTINVALETIPPTVTVAAVAPNPRTTAVASLSLTFSEAVNLVDLGDLSLTRNGVAVSLAGATLTTADNVTFTLSGLSGLTGTAGTYALTVNPGGLEDLAGNVMVVGGSTTWTVDLTPPTATASAAGVTAPNGVATVTVSYADNVGLNGGTIDSNDLLVTGPNGYSALAVLQSVSGSGASRTAVYAAPAPAGGWKSANNGTYTVSLRDGQVFDAAGNAAPAAALTGFGVALETTPPTAAFAAVSPNPRPVPVDAVGVAFSEPVTGFDPADLTLTRDGVAVSLAGAAVSSFDGVNYTVSGLSAATAQPGSYVLTLAAAGSGIADAAGNAIAAGAAVGFTVAQPPQPVPLANSGFEQPALPPGGYVYAASFDGWSVIGPAGVSAAGSPYTAGNPAAPEGAQVGFVLANSALTQSFATTAGGTYTLSLRAAQRANVLSALNLKVFVDGQLIGVARPAGTDFQSFALPSFALSAGTHELALVGLDPTYSVDAVLVDDVRLGVIADTAAPTAAVAAVSPNPRSGGVPSVSVTFSEPVTGFDPADLTLTRDGAPVDLSGVTVSASDGQNYTVAGLSAATAAAGQYVLTVNAAGTGIADAAGNPLAAAASTAWACSPLTVAVTGTVSADGKTASLSAAASGNVQSYAWSVVSAPAGGTATFAEPRSAAPTTTATFTAAGTYVLQATVDDGAGGTQSGTVTLTVGQVLSNVQATPPSASLAVNATQQFTAAGYDQFGAPMPIAGLQWAIYSGGGTIDAATGVYTAPSTASDVIVRAISGSGFIRSVPIAVGLPTTFSPLKVDFVPATKTVATGYQRDGGSTYGSRGNGYTYGWSVGHTDVVVDRDKNTNQLVDTSVGVKSGARWQLAVPNGQYTVKVGIGDSAVATTNTVRIEGTTAYSGTALAANAFSTKTVTVTVSDGVLTIDSGSAANLVTRLTHVEVSPYTVPPPPPPFTSAKVDFAPGSASVASGYMRDAGDTYGSRNGQTYGWNVSHTSNVYDRNKASTQLVDTVLVAKANAKWEMAVPNGTYTVKVGVGDATAKSTNTVKVEGGSLFSSTALAANAFQTKSITVTVSDGKLTLLVGSTDLVTRLTHVEVTKV